MAFDGDLANALAVSINHAGLEIFASRQKHRASGGRIHDYFLRGLVYVELENGKARRLTGSTPNSSRPGGGTAYYCLEGRGVNILCCKIDDQIAGELKKIQIDPDLIPLIRESYTDEIADRLGRMRPDQKADLERKLKDVDDEEARVLRLYAIVRITGQVWANLWEECQDRRRTLQINLDALWEKREVHIVNLDAALTN